MRHTENLLLKKPDLADSPPDITVFNENWDKIDEKLKKLPVQNGGLYIDEETTEEDKAEAIENIKGIGLSADDVGAVQRKIFWYEATGDTPLLTIVKNYLNQGYTSGVIQCIFKNGVPSDVPSNVVASAGVGLYSICKFQRHGYDFVDVELHGDSGLTAYKNRSLISNSAFPDTWVEIVNKNGYLPLDGSVPMSGSLGMNNHSLKFTPDSSWESGVYSSIERYDKGVKLLLRNNGVSRVVYFNDKSVDLYKAIQFWDETTSKSYDIYGEHNTDLLATKIQSLIDSGVIEVGGFRKPISVKTVSVTSDTSFTGSGHGVLYVLGNGNLKIVVDGNTLANTVSFSNTSGYVEIEFTTSFIVSTTGTITNRCAAVFYE